MIKKTISLLTIVFMVFCSFLLVSCGSNVSSVVEITDISLDINLVTLTEGESITLTATITPYDATDTSMVWLSSDPTVATVDYGSVMAIAEGEATITVSTSNGKSASCEVIVEAKEEEPKEKYNVTFYAKGGKFDNDTDTYKVSVEYGEKLTNVTVTRGEKYEFTGWYKDEYRTELWDFDNDTIYEDTNLFAGWKYLNSYQSVIDALAQKMRSERNNNDIKIEILSIFINSDGYFCFVEKDTEGVFSYSTDIHDLDKIIDNAELISNIPNANLTQIKNYNDIYTSDNNSYIADNMAYKYTFAKHPNGEIIYSCVSEWEIDTEQHIKNGGPYYCCKVKALVADEDCNVYDYSFTIVAGASNFNAVIGGSTLNEEFDEEMTALDENAKDFYSEHVKEKEA